MSALADWQALNDRQRIYLETLFRIDQEKEQDERGAWVRGGRARPAAEWRWIEYGPRELPEWLQYDPELRQRLMDRHLVDQGAGATWTALAKRGLLLLRSKAIRIERWRGQTLFVQITAKGRKLVRTGTGEKAPVRLPKGMLRARQWAALARLYQAGDAGVLNYELEMNRGGFAWMPTLMRLAHYEPHPLIEEIERRREGPYAGGSVSDWYYRITPTGREHYEREWSGYHALYPEAEAPEPMARDPQDPSAP